jgi:uncharacterized protein YjbI with pentapeptide repeats
MKGSFLTNSVASYYYKSAFMNTKYREGLIPQATKFEDRDFVDYDFTKTEMTEVVFKNVNFNNCIFDKTICIKTRFWCCFFDNCTFRRTDLNNTNLGAWGGGQSNCRFIKCKISKLVDASYLIDTIFDNCKLKGIEIRSYFLDNVKFIGFLDDFRIREFDTNEIAQYQTPEKAEFVKQKIREKIDGVFDNPKTTLKNIDFSEARLQFVDFSNCEMTNITVANDGKHLFINSNLKIISKQVYENIEQNWNNEKTKAWALLCTKKYLNLPAGIICYYDFKHYENEQFADDLMALFQQYNYY